MPDYDHYVDFDAIKRGDKAFARGQFMNDLDALAEHYDVIVPVHPGWDDTSAVQVGVRFSSAVAGSVTGIRFYKGTQNGGTHQGYLWSSTGSLPARCFQWAAPFT